VVNTRDTYRTFIAIELPTDVRKRVLKHIDQLRVKLPDVRASWSREDNLHLTLKFLGDVPVEHIPKLSDAVARAAHQIPSFKIMLSECGCFPPRGRPNVLWIGVQGDVLFHSHSAIEKECAAAGFPPEARPYHPHLTIARLRKPQGARSLAELHTRMGFTPESFSVSEVIVYRSELLREGSIHMAISRHKLQNVP
jgi:2'-5' RNA ligase